MHSNGEHPFGVKVLFKTNDYYFRGRTFDELRSVGYHPMPIKSFTNNQYIKIWEMYATSIFSFQPRGDSPTRRAFYDSWMFGCIPVISTKDASYYEEIFHGMLFFDTPLDQMAVYVDENVMYDGFALIKFLSSFSEGEVETRRTKMAKIAPYLQVSTF